MTTSARLEVAVIGGGAIGSRHVQGLARLTRPTRIHAVDPSEAARALCARRFGETTQGPDVVLSLLGDARDLPERLDFAVVATPAAVRLDALEALLGGRRVGRVVLEKFLFPRRVDYVRAESLIEAAGVEAFVNTPRRLWPGYAALRARLDGRGPVSVSVETSRRNGLASNAIHFLDLAAYLGAVEGGFRLSGAGLEPRPDAARRGAAIEFAGLLEGRSAAGDVFSHRSLLDDDRPHSLVIRARGFHAEIDEIGGSISVISDSEATDKPYRSAFAPVMQSALTHKTMEVPADAAGLPTYAASALLHRQCLEAFLEAMKADPLCETAMCPIT